MTRPIAIAAVAAALATTVFAADYRVGQRSEWTQRAPPRHRAPVPVEAFGAAEPEWAAPSGHGGCWRHWYGQWIWMC